MTAVEFHPDPFQVKAFEAFDEGANVIVAAPTGAGKTLVANYAVDHAMKTHGRVFYTTPIKALSNQKFHDLCRVYGSDRVGLLTGDNAINGDAPVVVMTTEVLRNMIYAGRSTAELSAVILDEVHYLQDSYRGPVWEEVIIHLDRSVQLVCLSATVSNADELAAWMETVRGATRLVVETKRPVELENRYLVAEKRSSKEHFIRTIINGKANQKGFRFDVDLRSRGRRAHRPYRTPYRTEVVELLDRQRLLPAIFFIFSRAGCSEAARTVTEAGLVLTSDSEQAEIRKLAAERAEALNPEDLEVLGYAPFLDGLVAGVAPHHAGMVPPLKELVEVCFERGLIKVVFSTETLALGVNMPARTVVIDKLTKWTGESHEFLTPAQYTQLTGRAGRRGIDTKGEAIVLWSPWVRFEQVAELAASREFTLRSAFRPTYNMAANLVRRYEPERARQLLNLSFAQFRADANTVRAEEKLERMYERRNKIRRQVEADFGPIDELQAAVGAPSKQRDQEDISHALTQLLRGEVLQISGQGLPDQVVVLAIAHRKGRRVKVHVANAECDTFELTADMLEEAPTVVGTIKLPEPYLPHSMSFIHAAVESMNTLAPQSSDQNGSNGTLAADTKAGLSGDIPRAARRGLKRLAKIDGEIAVAQAAVRSNAESLARQFDRVTGLLEDRGHLDGWSLTESGERVAKLYHESDLFIVEALDAGVFDSLSVSELTALASTLVYEDRRSGPDTDIWFPSRILRTRFNSLLSIHEDLAMAERASDLPETRTPDSGFISVAHAWAAGGNLDDVLDQETITAGDFVRTAKLLIDLLRQLSSLATDPNTRRVASQASDAVFRDLVAASSTVEPIEPAES